MVRLGRAGAPFSFCLSLLSTHYSIFDPWSRLLRLAPRMMLVLDLILEAKEARPGMFSLSFGTCALFSGREFEVPSHGPLFSGRH